MYYFQELPAKQVWIEQEFEKKKIPRIIYETTHIIFLSTTIVKKSFHYWDHPENIGSSRLLRILGASH